MSASFVLSDSVPSRLADFTAIAMKFIRYLVIQLRINLSYEHIATIYTHL